MEGGDRGWGELKQKVYCKLRLGTEYKWQRLLPANNSKSGLSSTAISREMDFLLPRQARDSPGQAALAPGAVRAHGLCCPWGHSSVTWGPGAPQPQPPKPWQRLTLQVPVGQKPMRMVAQGAQSLLAQGAQQPDSSDLEDYSRFMLGCEKTKDRAGLMGTTEGKSQLSS